MAAVQTQILYNYFNILLGMNMQELGWHLAMHEYCIGSNYRFEY